MNPGPSSEPRLVKGDKTPSRPEDVRVITPGRRKDPDRYAATDLTTPPDSAGGR